MDILKNYPGLCEECTPAGTRRWRVRVEGQKTRRITLAVGPGHEDFEALYEAAREGRKLNPVASSKVVKGTLDELC